MTGDQSVCEKAKTVAELEKTHLIDKITEKVFY